MTLAGGDADVSGPPVGELRVISCVTGSGFGFPARLFCTPARSAERRRLARLLLSVPGEVEAAKVRVHDGWGPEVRCFGWRVLEVKNNNTVQVRRLAGGVFTAACFA